MDCVAFGLNAAARHHRVLSLERVRDCCRGNTECREARKCNFDINAFALHTDQLRLLHGFDGEDAAACVFCHLPQLLIGVVRACDGIDGAIYIVKAVVVVGPIDAVRQVAAYVLAKVAHIAPRWADQCGVYIVAQADIDDGLPRTRFACDLFQPRDVLKAALEFVCDLLLHFFGRCTRPCG